MTHVSRPTAARDDTMDSLHQRLIDGYRHSH